MERSHLQRPRHVAMKDNRRQGQERRDRGRAGQGGAASRRSSSPAPRRPRDGDRESDNPKRLTSATSRPTRPPKDISRGRSRDHPRRPTPPPPPARRDRDDRRDDRYQSSRPRDLIDTRRGHPGSDRGEPRRSRSANRRRSRGGGPSQSPGAKRPRSRSPVQSGIDRKRARRDDSPRWDPKDRSRNTRDNRDTRREPHLSPRSQSRRSPSPGRGDSHTRPKESKRHNRRRSRSRSPRQDPAGPRPEFSPPRRLDQSRARKRSRSPLPSRVKSPRQLSPVRNRRGRSPSPRPQEPKSRTQTDSDRQRQNRSRHTSRSTSRGSGNRTTQGEGQNSKDQPSSGVNSIEVNMSGRGGRGSFGARHQMHNAFSSNAAYNDPRQYSQSPHVTPNPYHNSPNQSPYGRNSWSGSPQHHPGQYPQGNYNAPSGPKGQYPSNTYSPPPSSAPTGPMQQFSRGSNYRGGSAPFRGNQFNLGRGGYRGNNFKSTQWNSNGHASSGRGGFTQIETTNSQRSTTAPSEMDDGNTAVEQPNPFRPSKDLQVEDTTLEKSDEKEMPPPTRQPPSGPSAQSNASSKFSFAFKASAKPTPAAPKPEISQKFNAAPQEREPSQQPDSRERDVPHGAPTEPASARARPDHRHQVPPGPKAAPPPPPQTRTVKRKMKRLKHREVLPSDLFQSESVYFRKPGNESVVGSGTYGKVFKGLHVYTKQLVALKRIRMEGEKDGFPVTAVREIKLLQSLRHPNIVQLMEVMVEKNDCFMVFEYLSHDLTGLLNHPTFKLDVAQKKHLAKQTFEGLDYLHKRGVLHRDLKAANILVSSDGILKIADFGLARFYAKRHQLDYTNRVITIWYRSPELLLGETKYGPSCDIWSTACIMMEIFTHHATFAGDGTEVNQLDKIYSVMGTPNKTDWPGLVNMPWFELLRPGYRKANTFAAKYKDNLTPAAYDLMSSIFRYDPAQRPTAAEALEHAYFTSEEPAPRQAIELATIDGDWHELESKAHRKENERREREARHASRKEGRDGKPREKDRKRENESHDQRGDAKRVHTEGGKPAQLATTRGEHAATASSKA